ncbi:MAG: methyl-accepting chemotaxis protein [Candidatus Eremiobacterota bacterium]
MLAENLEKNYKTWMELLGKYASAIESVNKSTENEFLSIGSKLMELSSMADKMSGECSSAVNLIAGQEMINSIEGLGNLSDSMERYLKDSDINLQNSSKNLGHIKQMLDNICKPMEGFKKIVKVLKMMAISTRIESARLGRSDAGFNTLADDIKKLAARIAIKSSDITEQSKVMSDIIGDTMSGVVLLETEQHKQIITILNNVRTSLSSLQDMNINSSSAANNILLQSQNICTNIGEVVMSIQFHDITRQQIEHVVSALNDACKWLKEEIQNGNGGEDFIGRIRYICELQRAQLAYSLKEFVEAVNRIQENLQAIDKHITAMSEEIKNTVGDIDRTGSSFLGDIEKGLASVISSLLKSEDTHRNVSNSMGSGAAKVKQMCSFAGDIEQTGKEIELIALNARIKATHIGESGAAMGAIAEAIQQLSLDSRSQTGSVLDFLNNISDASEKLSKDTSEGNKGHSDTDNMVRKLKSLVNSLRKMNENIIILMTHLNTASKDLSFHIEKTVKEIKVHTRVSSVINNILKDLDEIVVQARKLEPASTAGKKDFLKDLEIRYTMDSERKIHLSKVSQVKPEISKATHKTISSKIPAKSRPLQKNTGVKKDIPDKKLTHQGDNVELFADSATGNNVELFGESDSSMGDNVELFGDSDSSMGDNVELFGDSATGDNVELFEENKKDKEEDLGDNVELF